MGKNKRLVSVDCARAQCMLFVIGVYHMKGSYLENPGLVPALSRIIVPVLATFTGISGWFLGRKKMETRADVTGFYKSRLVRAYPFFLLSCLSLYAVSLVVGKYFHGIRQLLLTLVGLSPVFGPAPGTVWYISMLLLFWLLTPLFIYRRKNTPTDAALRFMGLLLFIALLWGLDRLGAEVDIRVPLYGIVYFAVLILSPWIKLDDHIHPVPAAVAAVVFALAEFMPMTNTWLRVIQHLLHAFSGMVLVLFLGTLCAKVPMLSKALGWVSYASMVAYLFHRQWLGVWLTVCGPFNIPLALVLLIALIAGSYLAQWLYDKCVIPKLK